MSLNFYTCQVYLSYLTFSLFGEQVFESSHDFGSGLLQEGLEAKNDTFVGIYSANRAEVSLLKNKCHAQQ